MIQIAKVGCCICPLYHLQQYLKDRPYLTRALFCHFNGSTLTRYQFSAVLKKTLQVLGFDYSRYKSHSFRIGAASTAAEIGWSADIIKMAGRWSSDAYKSYVRPVSFSMPTLFKPAC